MEGDTVIELSDVLTPEEVKEFTDWLSRKYPDVTIHPRITPEMVKLLDDEYRMPRDRPSRTILDKLMAAR